MKDGLIIMTIGDIRNEEVLSVRSECAEELISTDICRGTSALFDATAPGPLRW